jgi:alpha-amylase
MEAANSNGYDTYDLFDLGEFDQKGSVRTKFGTQEQYAKAVAVLHEPGIQAYVDIVLNHKGGADEMERRGN